MRQARLQAEAVAAAVRRDASGRRTRSCRRSCSARDGDANIGRAAVTLPHALFLDQSNIATVCTRVQFAANACPKNSVYGYARAFTPLLDKPLEGPVYLRSSNNLLPDLVADLHGQVDIDLRRRDRHQQGPDPQHLRHRPRRAGVEVRPDHQRRQEGPPRQLAATICAKKQRQEARRASCKAVVKAHRAERQEGRTTSSCTAADALRQEASKQKQRHGGRTSLRVGAPDALGPDRRLEQPRGAGADAAGAAARAGRGRRADRRRQRLRRRHRRGGARAGAGGAVVRSGRNARLRRRLQRRRRGRPSGDLLVILNPDAAPLPGFGEAIRRPWLRGARLGRLAGAGRRRRRRRGSTRPATRSTSPASSGPAATAGRSPRRRRPAR